MPPKKQQQRRSGGGTNSATPSNTSTTPSQAWAAKVPKKAPAVCFNNFEVDPKISMKIPQGFQKTPEFNEAFINVTVDQTSGRNETLVFHHALGNVSFKPDWDRHWAVTPMPRLPDMVRSSVSRDKDAEEHVQTMLDKMVKAEPDIKTNDSGQVIVDLPAGEGFKGKAKVPLRSIKDLFSKALKEDLEKTEAWREWKTTHDAWSAWTKDPNKTGSEPRVSAKPKFKLTFDPKVILKDEEQILGHSDLTVQLPQTACDECQKVDSLISKIKGNQDTRHKLLEEYYTGHELMDLKTRSKQIEVPALVGCKTSFQARSKLNTILLGMMVVAPPQAASKDE